MYPIDGLRLSPARLQPKGRRERAKALLSNNAFALTGRGLRPLLPRAMPWANCSLPLWGAIG